MRKTAFLMACLFSGFAALASAQTPSRPAMGTITARSYAPLPPGAAIVIQPGDDTDQSQRIKSSIEAELKAHGYQVVNDGPLILQFYSTEVIGSNPVVRPGSQRLNQSSIAPVDKPIPRPDQSSGTSILSGLNRGLFGGTTQSSDQPGAKPEPRQVHLSVMLNNSKPPQRIWEGAASGEQRQPDSFAATQALVPFLMDKIGKTVAMERFDMPQ